MDKETGGASPVALILVHGIGEQRPGDTRKKFLGAICARFPGVEVELPAAGEGAAILRGTPREVRVYETHWAPLLSGEFVADSFRTDALFEIGWFPTLNLERGSYGPGEYSERAVRGWTFLLLPLVLLLHLALLGVGTFLQLTRGVFASRGIREERRRLREADRSLRREAGGGLRGMWAVARKRARDGRDEHEGMKLVLDRVVADVTNYVDAAAGAFPEAVPGERREAAGQIEDVLRRTVARAVEEDGCGEIQILAHSLGTVVAFRVLSMDGATLESRTPPADPDPASGPTSPPVPITVLYTIGSPLEKVRFLWPSILGHRPGRPAVVGPGGPLAVGNRSFRWENFSSPLDLVSGRLVRFDLWGAVQNHPAPEVGGLARAHISYEDSPGFLELLGSTLMGRPPEGRPTPLRRGVSAASGVLETLALPSAFLGMAFLGGVFLWFTVWMLTGQFLRIPEAMGLLSAEGRLAWARGMGFAAVAVVALGGFPEGRRRASEIHAAHFAPARDVPLRSITGDRSPRPPRAPGRAADPGGSTRRRRTVRLGAPCARPGVGPTHEEEPFLSGRRPTPTSDAPTSSGGSDALPHPASHVPAPAGPDHPPPGRPHDRMLR